MLIPAIFLLTGGLASSYDCFLPSAWTFLGFLYVWLWKYLAFYHNAEAYLQVSLFYGCLLTPSHQDIMTRLVIMVHTQVHMKAQAKVFGTLN